MRVAKRGWVIGLTGGTGAGKSAIAARLRRVGAAYYSVDRAAHALYRPGTRVHRALVARFGRQIRGAGDVIDRRRLGDAAFSSSAALASLNRIVHPALAREAAAAIRRMGAAHRLVVLEAGPILFALGLDRLADRVVVVRAAPDVRRRRLAGAAGGREGRAGLAKRLAALAPAERAMERAAARCSRAVIVDTTGGAGTLQAAARRLASEAGVTPG